MISKRVTPPNQLEAHDLALDMQRVVNDILQAKGLLLRTGTAVDATLIAAPSSTRNAEGERDPEMHQLKKGNPEAAGPAWHVAMRPGKRRLLIPFIEPEFMAERVQKMKAGIRAKVEHPFRLSGELLSESTGVAFQHAPYRDSGPMLADLMGGQADYAIGNLPSALPLIHSDKLRALAVTSVRPSALLPDVPTATLWEHTQGVGKAHAA